MLPWWIAPAALQRHTFPRLFCLRSTPHDESPWSSLQIRLLFFTISLTAFPLGILSLSISTLFQNESVVFVIFLYTYTYRVIYMRESYKSPAYWSIRFLCDATRFLLALREAARSSFAVVVCPFHVDGFQVYSISPVWSQHVRCAISDGLGGWKWQIGYWSSSKKKIRVLYSPAAIWVGCSGERYSDVLLLEEEEEEITQQPFASL